MRDNNNPKKRKENASDLKHPIRDAEVLRGCEWVIAFASKRLSLMLIKVFTGKNAVECSTGFQSALPDRLAIEAFFQTSQFLSR
jgi:hypothetical protein